MIILQILSALLLFLNKLLVLKNKPIGWIVGLLGLFAITPYFYLQMVWENKPNLWIMVVFEIGLMPIMVYGYLISYSKEGTKLKEWLKSWNILVKTIIFIITIFVCTLLLIGAITSQLVIIQFIFSVTFIFAALLLSFDRGITNLIGWILSLVAHVLCTYITYTTGSPIIAFFQIASGVVAITGIIKESKKIGIKNSTNLLV